MTIRIPTAFYAPLKSPEHPAPSGDRTMGRLLLKALAVAGFEPSLASGIRTYEPTGDQAAQLGIQRASLAEADRLTRDFEALPQARRPQLWFTYHCYYKAPDWIGPLVADRLGLTYVVAEGSRAGKRAGGAWDLAHRGAEAALDRAGLIFVMTDDERAALERTRPERQRLVDLPPFLDAAAWLGAKVHPRRRGSGPIRLLAVAMMRAGDKLASYEILALSLKRLDELGFRDWEVTIVGDGPARPGVEAAFAGLVDRTTFLGRVDEPAWLARVYRDADLLVWPAVNEAYGMVLLEAQALGLPVVAGRYGGVANAMRDEATGLLVTPGDPEALASAIRTLAGDRGRLAAMSGASRRFVLDERDLPQAATRLRAALVPALARAVAA